MNNKKPTQVRLVDAAKVEVLKRRAVKFMHQNVHDTLLAGIVLKETLTYLGLWDDVTSITENTKEVIK